jgi:hypothetical protein
MTTQLSALRILLRMRRTRDCIRRIAIRAAIRKSHALLKSAGVRVTLAQLSD